MTEIVPFENALRREKFQRPIDGRKRDAIVDRVGPPMTRRCPVMRKPYSAQRDSIGVRLFARLADMASGIEWRRLSV
jgi:hypothetical protein